MKLMPVKDPNAFLDYYNDWTTEDWLSVGETISTSTWSANSPDITLSLPANTGTVTSVWVRGGISGQTYTITNHIISSLSREDDRTLVIPCKER